MAFGTASKVMARYVLGLGQNNRKTSTDAYKMALYKNTGTPTNKVSTYTLSKYNGTSSAWVTANEVSGTGYTAGGKALASVTWTQSTNKLKFTSANVTWTSTTVATAYGAFVYDTTAGATWVTTGIAYLSFGGANSVTAGTFTVSISATGIALVTC